MKWTNEIESILRNQEVNGGPFWSREDGDIHAPHGCSTIDTLHVLGELGATIKNHNTLSEAVDFIFTYQTPDGSFKYSKTSPKLPCMTARILSALGRLGAKDDIRLKKSYQQLLDTQWYDNGWRCNTVKVDKSPETDASNPGTTLYVLDAFRFRNNTPEELNSLNSAVDFILHHWDIRIPLGPCEFGIGTRFLKTEFPFFRYNLFYYVYTLSFYTHAHKDKRFLEAYNALLEKTDKDNIILENPHRAWREYNFAHKGEVSELASMRLNEIKENINYCIENLTDKPNS